LEELSLNGWPSLQTVLYDGWLLRFADGYTKRSNSVSAIYRGGDDSDLERKIAFCEKMYEARGIRTVFKVTPFVPALLDEKLERLGYAKIDHTLVKTARLSDIANSPRGGLEVKAELTEEWLEAIAGMQRLGLSQLKTTRAMLESQPLRQGFALLKENGVPVACGLVVIEGSWAGIYDLVTAPDARGRGCGEQVTRGLFGFARGLGAEMGYLLVVRDNAAANRLYDKLGFEPAYDYWYRVAPSG
jgi:ribosomal protein S18 acetylase RimI-like enzyme